jgi:hypothetical protein
MEATRVRDEEAHGELSTVLGAEARPAEDLECSSRGAGGAFESERPGPDTPGAHEALALAAARRAGEQELGEDQVDTDGAISPEAATAAGAGPACLIAIDPDLDTLEWLKTALEGLLPRIHIFQRCESGIARIRQYLGRAEVPLVMLSAEAPADPLLGMHDLGDLVRRLKAQAPRMPILVMHERDAGAPPGVEDADAVLPWPEPHRSSRARRPEALEDAARELRGQLRAWAEWSAAPAGQPDLSSPRPDAAAPSPAHAEPGPGRPRETSSRLSRPSSRGDVLFPVLEFAAESFSRVAMFMLRDDVAEGMAQLGLAAAGGPDDEGLRALRLGAGEIAWFRAAIERRRALRSAPSDEGDRELAGHLGTGAPREAYVAPIESGGQVVALLYGDNLPDERPIGDTSALEAAILEAGLALDRALLGRTLGEVEPEPGDPAAEN